LQLFYLELVIDGSEITEAVSLFIELGRAGVKYDIFAPNKDFKATTHHSLTNIELGVRNAMEESSRITRGNIRDLEELTVTRYDGIALPGGYGIAKNLSTWAQDGPGCTVNKKFKEVLQKMHESSKPILALCIAPALVARVLGQITQPNVTVGNDEETIKNIERCGGEHIECKVSDFVSDRENKIVTTPAYMFEVEHYEVFEGIQKACKEFLEMC